MFARRCLQMPVVLAQPCYHVTLIGSRADRSGKGARRYRDFRYRTRKSWSCERRVVGKAEYLPGKTNPRFVVTNLPRHRAAARRLYEKLYCVRGEMENRIKERQLGLFADRTSTATMRANQLRLYFSSFAYVMMYGLRRLGLRKAPVVAPNSLKIGHDKTRGRIIEVSPAKITGSPTELTSGRPSNQNR